MLRKLLVIVIFGSFLFWGRLYLTEYLKPTSAQSDAFQTQDPDLAKTYELIRDEYVEPVDMEVLDTSSPKAMVASLHDKFSYVLTDSDREQLRNLDKGEYTGLGLSFTPVEGYPTVIMVIVDSPAYKAGIEIGDQVLAVNGTSTRSISDPDFKDLMNAAEAGRVTLEMKTLSGIQTFELEPAIFEFHTVFYNKIGDNLGYLRITNFAVQTPHELEEILNLMKEDDIAGVILDLRGNGGGLLSSGDLLLDAFTQEGRLYSQKFRDGTEDVRMASGKALFPDAKMVILVDRSTASMAELVSASLRENGRTKLIGEQTLGKGTIVRTFELPSGTFVNLAIGKWYSPHGSNFHGIGLMPDVEYLRPWQDNGKLLELAVQTLNRE